MTKGQRAMAVAKIYPEAAKTKRKGAGSLETKELSGTWLTKAGAPLRRSFLLPGADEFGYDMGTRMGASG